MAHNLLNATLAGPYMGLVTQSHLRRQWSGIGMIKTRPQVDAPESGSNDPAQKKPLTRIIHRGDRRDRGDTGANRSYIRFGAVLISAECKIAFLGFSLFSLRSPRALRFN